MDSIISVTRGAAATGRNLHRGRKPAGTPLVAIDQEGLPGRIERADNPLRLRFGAHKGKLVSQCPDDYVLWLADPKHERPTASSVGRSAGAARGLPTAIVKEARRLAIDIRAKRDRRTLIADLKRGKPHDRPHPLYLIECDGDMHSASGDFVFDATVHDSLDAALATIAAEYPRTPAMATGPGQDGDVPPTPDQEDDRIVVWEILPTGHSRAVWGFFGYHWSADEFHCGQGTLPGDDVDLYTLADLL